MGKLLRLRMICNNVIDIFCYWANLCIFMEALFEIDLGPACKKANLDILISLEDNKEKNGGNKSQGQHFGTRSQVWFSERCLIGREIVSFVERM